MSRKGVYKLCNAGPYEFNGYVYVNGKFSTITKEKTITVVKDVSVGDRITLMKKSGFLGLGKEIFADFRLNEESINYESDNYDQY